MSAAHSDSLLNQKAQDLSFGFSQDPDLVRQYMAIYQQEFRLTHGLPNYRSVAEEHDQRSSILIVRQGDTCVGGARLSVRTPEQPLPLPIEMGDFRLANHFPHLRDRTARYGQLGRFCLLPQFRGGAVTRAMFRHLHAQAQALAITDVFGTAIRVLARAQKISLLSVGVQDVRIYDDIKLPEYPMCEGVTFLLLRGVISKPG